MDLSPRHRRSRTAHVAGLVVFALFLAPLTVQAQTAVYLVRHAEKAKDPGDGDPTLTEAGKKRAAKLAHVLEGVRLDAIYTTRFKRNRGTAAPIAKALGLKPKVVPAHPASKLAETLKAQHPEQRVLVVGHSNTVPELIELLSAKKVQIEHQQYDDLFLVLVSKDGHAELHHLRYGAPSPSP